MMLELGVRIVVSMLRVLNLCFKPLRLREKVVVISRQSNEATLDIELLCNEMDKNNMRYVVLAKTFKKSVGGVISYGFHMINQMYHLASSKVVVLDGYCILASVLPHKKGQRIVQMWHALGAIKQFGWQNTEHPDGHSRTFSEIMKMHRNYDYVVAPGKITGTFFAEAFHASKEKVVYYGLPRIDYLRIDDDEKREEIQKAYPQLLGKELVLYVPTFRKNAAIEMESFIAEFPFRRFNLVIKKHFLDKGDYTWAESAGAVIDNRFSSLEWLRVCNKVITDYSAIAFEAAIAEKELYIFQPDANNYAHNVGLNVDLKQEAIGEYVFRNEIELVSALKDSYLKEKMISFRNKYIEIKLDNCTADLCRFIKTLLSD